MAQPTIQQTFDLALQHHQARRLREAEQLYRQILTHDPNHAGATHYLGVVAMRVGQTQIAIDLIRRAIAINPGYAEAHYHLGNALRDSGQLDQAINAWRQATSLKPDFPEAHNNLGAVLRDKGEFDEAIVCFRQAIAYRPHLDDAHNNLGRALTDKGDYHDAIAALRQAIALNPANAKAHSNLGNALRNIGQLDEAIAAHRQAVALNPTQAEAQNNLAIALRDKGRLDDAIAAHRQAVVLDPTQAEVHSNLGSALRDKKQLDEAISAYRQAISLNPKLPEPYYNLGGALKDRGQIDAAISAYQQAIAINPKKPEFHQALGQALEKQGNIDQAIAAYKAAQQWEPNPVINNYHLAALGVADAPPASPRQYLTELFDDYSVRFDQHLQQLEYQGPQLLFDAVTATAPQQPLDITDLGCGTGLCGALFRPMARHLTGIDVAPRMIERSRQRGVYDELIANDLTLILKDRPASCDLILAADVFIYVGRLEEVFQAAALALRPSGLFAFTVECIDAGDYVLRRSRRYAQSLTYIRRLASLSHLTEISVKPAVLRMESGKPVDSLVIVLQKPANSLAANVRPAPVSLE